MSSRLQLDMCNLSLGRRHLVSAYEVEAGIGVIAGSTTVWSMPERLECEVLQKVRYINTLTFTFTFTCVPVQDVLSQGILNSSTTCGISGCSVEALHVTAIWW